MQTWTFSRLFELPALNPTNTEIKELTQAMAQFDFNAPGLAAGYTYLGQFIDHDLSLQREHISSPQPRAVELHSLYQGRKPSLELDSLYGAGLEDSVVRYSWEGKFELGTSASGKPLDLRRDDDGTPLIADPRNDEHLLVSQLQVLYMRLHNAFIDLLHQRDRGHKATHFEEAKKELIYCHQWLALHDFGQQILPKAVYRTIIEEDKGWLGCQQQRLSMPVEFSGACFRFGHSMIRRSYRLNKETADAKLMDLFMATHRGLTKDQPLDDKLVVDWSFFFDFYNHPDYQRPGRTNRARRLDPSVTVAMRSIPRPDHSIDIIGRNLERSRELGLPAGQSIYHYLWQEQPEVAETIGLKPYHYPRFEALLDSNSRMREQTPLWLYTLLEADRQSRGMRLGPLGGWIVADTLRKAVRQAGNNFYQAGWSPQHSLIADFLHSCKRPNQAKQLSIEDLIVFIDKHPTKMC